MMEITSIKPDDMSLARVWKELQKRMDLVDSGLVKRGGTVEWVAVKLVTALRAGTVRSKARRTVIENPLRQAAMVKHFNSGKTVGKSKKLAAQEQAKWAVVFDYKPATNGRFPLLGQGSYLPILGNRKGDAKADKLVQLKDFPVGKRGLARMSWQWTLKALHKPSDSPALPGVTESTFTSTTSAGVSVGTWTGVNKLAYIRAAMTRPVSSSVHAAATMMRTEGERLIAEAKRGVSAA